MDQGHYDQLVRMAPDGAGDRIRLFMDYAPDAPRREVPDPYYGEGTHFTEVLDLVEAASSGLLDQRHVKPVRGLAPGATRVQPSAKPCPPGGCHRVFRPGGIC